MDESRAGEWQASHSKLYWQLLGELGGGWGRAMKEYLGRPSLEVFEALEARMAAFVGPPGVIDPRWKPDIADVAAARCLAKAALAVHDPDDFQIITKRTFGDLHAFLAKTPRS